MKGVFMIDHWSQASHRLNVFGLNGVAAFLTIPLLLLSSLSWIFLVILIVMWAYCIIFENILKMPLRCSFSLIRTIITGTDKNSKNISNPFGF